jgi:hypothetical protein
VDVEALRAGNSRRLCLDVTVEAIVALAHRNFARDATSWRNLLAGIHGTARDHGTLVWIESDVGTAPFVTSEAGRDLRLCTVGGAVRFGNGMHRLVATACLLIAGVNGAHIRIASGRAARFFKYARGSLTLEENALRRRLRVWVRSRLRPVAEEAIGLRWHRVTPHVASVLTSDKWLQQPLESPHYPHLPT